MESQISKPVYVPKHLPAGYPVLNEDEVAALCKRVAKLTDYNNHTESLLQVARFFRFTKSEKVLKAIAIIHEERPMNLYLGEVRSNESDLMLSNIEYFYGKELRDRINKSL